MERREWVSALGSRVLLIQRDRSWTWALEIEGVMREADASFGSATAALIAAGATVFYLWVAEETSSVSLPADVVSGHLRPGPLPPHPVPPPHGSGGG